VDDDYLRLLMDEWGFEQKLEKAGLRVPVPEEVRQRLERGVGRYISVFAKKRLQAQHQEARRGQDDEN